MLVGFGAIQFCACGTHLFLLGTGVIFASQSMVYYNLAPYVCRLLCNASAATFRLLKSLCVVLCSGSAAAPAFTAV